MSASQSIVTDLDNQHIPPNLPPWERMQYKSFRKWVQVQLSQRALSIVQLEKDFEDGYKLWNLLEVLAQKKIGKSLAKPRSRIQCVNNLGICFHFMLKEEKIRLENIGVEDVVDGSLKLILGLLWTLILRYQISKLAALAGGSGKTDGKGGDNSMRKWLLDWCKCIAHYRDVSVTNLTTSFQDGMAFNAMIHLYNPDLVNYDALKKTDRLSNLTSAFKILEDEFGVPRLLDPKDMAGSDEPDEKSVMTYLASCISAFDKYQRKGVVSQRADASKCVAHGPGAELASTAEPAEFYIQAKDKDGNKLLVGGDNFKVKITGPLGLVDAVVKDNKNGTYTVNYQATNAGPHLIHVTLEGKPISNSPLVVEAEYNASHLNVADAKWSVAYGAGTELASDAEPSTFYVQAKNKYGNKVTKGGDEFKVNIKGVSPVDPAKVVDNNDGTYTVTYQAKQPGDYAIDVTLHEKSIHNSPFNVLCEHNTGPATEVDPRWSSASGQGIQNANTIEPANFTIQAKNKYGNPIKQGGSNFDVNIKGFRDNNVPAKVVDKNDGTYQVTYQPIAAGDHLVGISLKGTQIFQSPHTVPVSQKADPSKTIAFGAGTQIGSTAEPAQFIIQAKDKLGNNCVKGGERFKIKVLGPNNNNDQNIEAKIDDNNDGTYTITYQPRVPGNHKVEVILDSKPISNSPFNVQVDFNTDVNTISDPKWSIAYGPGVELASTAEPSDFIIQAKNKYGNNIQHGGDQFNVDFPKSTSLTIKDNKNGTYSVHYQATTEGTHDLKVTLKSTPISNSPYSVKVDKNNSALDEPDARWTSASGPGTVSANTANPSNNFNVQAKNKYGNNVNKGGAPFKSKVKDSTGKPVEVDLVDNNNGTYSVAYKPTSSGSHKVDVTLGNSSIYKCPISVPVIQETDASKCKAFGPGTEIASTAEPAQFTIQAIDRVGNKVNRGGDHFKVKIKTPSGTEIEGKVLDNQDGTYQVNYQPKVAGDYTILCSLEGKSISNSPLKVKVEANSDYSNVTDPKWSLVKGPGTEIASTAETSEFTIFAKNKYGNPVKKGGDTFKVDLKGTRGSTPVEPQIKDNNDGTYKVTYKPTVSGILDGDVRLNDKSLSNTPFRVVVEQNDKENEVADPKWSTISGQGVELGDTSKPNSNDFVITAKNRYGNKLKKGGDDFTIKINGYRKRPVFSSLKDNNDGTYSGSYKPIASGNHLIDVKLDGTSIADCPRRVQVHQETDASKSVAFGAGTEIGSTAEIAEFTIQAKDKLGNKCNRGGDKFKVDIQAPSNSPQIHPQIKDNHDGTYTVKYQPAVAGAHKIDVTLDGKPISNMPKTSNIEANSEKNMVVDPKWSTAKGPGTELASTAETSEFLIEARNKYGNIVPKGGSPFQVQLTTPAGSPDVKAKLEDNHDGTYKVTYRPLVPVDHPIDVTLGGKSIFASPFIVPVEHNTKYDEEADARWSEASGPGIENANTTEPAEFTIQAKNRYGNKVHQGGSGFITSIKVPEGSSLVDADVKDNEDGTYSVQYQPTASGNHGVEVTLDDWNIHNSPFIVPVTQGTDPSTSFAHGPGVEIASTAEPSQFTIQAKDKLGNKVNRGGDKFKVKIHSNNSTTIIPSTIKDNHDGTYQVNYQANVPGKQTVEVTLNEKHIKNSPYQVNVEKRDGPDTVTDAKWSCCTGAGTEVCSTAEPARFTIHAKNKYGNDVKKGGDPFKVQIKAPAGSPTIDATIKDNNDGTYEVTYQSKVPGEHLIDVNLQGKSLLNCPFKVKSEHNTDVNKEVSAKWSEVSGPGTNHANTIEPADFTIQAKNKYGNPLTTGGNDFKVNIKEPSGSKPVIAKIKDNQNGTYSVQYQPNASGNHLIDVALQQPDGTLNSLNKCPFNVPVTQTTDASQCEALGAGTQIASTAEPAQFTIQAKDKLGNHCNRGGDDFKVIVKTPNGSTDTIKAKVKDNHDGTYTVTYQPLEAGQHEVDITLGGKRIKNAPCSVQVEKNVDVNTITDPKWSVAEGPGVERASTAETSEFTIFAKNKYGNPITKGGDPFKVQINSSSGTNVPSTITDNHDGTYKVIYQNTTAGNSTVNVTLNNQAIFKSPYSVIVDKNDKVSTEADPRWTEALGQGTTKANIVEPASFVVQAKNKYGNKLNKGGDNLNIGVHSPNPKTDPHVEANVHDNNDGTYSVTYQPLVTGPHQVDVNINDNPIHRSPLDVLVNQGTDASKCVPFGPGFESAIVGETATFTVQAKDKNFNKVKAGGDDFKATVVGPQGPIPVVVKDNNDGTYSISYTPNTPGYHDVNVSLEGEPIAYCPFSVPVKQLTDPSKCTLTGQGIKEATTTDPADFTIQAKDKAGNDLKVGGDDFYVKVNPPPGSKPVFATVKDNGNGSYSVHYQPTSPGDHSIEVSLAGKPVGNSPIKVPVRQYTDPSKSIAYGPGFDDASTGTPAIFIVQAKDKNGGNVTRGGDAFKATVIPPTPNNNSNSITPTIEDRNNGTYVVSFQPLIPGAHKLDISLDGKSISNMPSIIQVRQDVDPSKCIASGNGIKEANTLLPATFIIEARDRSGNKVNRGGEKFNVKVTASNGFPVEAKIKDLKDGTYEVTYQPFSPGKHNIEITLGDKHISNSPISLEVEAGPATVMTDFELEVWRELNKARMSPKIYASYLKDLIPQYDSNGGLTVPNTKFVRPTREGLKGLQDAISFLETADTAPALKINETLSYSCRDLCADLGPKGEMGNVLSDGTPPDVRLSKYGRWKGKLGEIISYGAYSAQDVVISWLVDDGQPDRPNRKQIFDPEFHVVGIASGPHAKLMRMCAVALTGAYIDGEVEPERVPREIKVNKEKETLSFDRFATKDGSGYLIPVGPMYTSKENIQLFKEGRMLHIERTIISNDGEPLVSHFRYEVPFDFDPITVLARLDGNQNLFLFLSKPAGALDPNTQVVLTQMSFNATPSRPNEKLDIKVSESSDFFLFQCVASKSREEVTVQLKGRVLTFATERFVIGVDEEGEYESVVKGTKSITLPYPLPLNAFSLTKEKDSLTLKAIKPTSTSKADARIEIPVQDGHFDVK